MHTPRLRDLAVLTLLPISVSSAASPPVQSAGERFVERIPGTEVSFEMAFVPGGRLVVGSSAGAAETDDRPGPTVSVASFWIGVHEVTSEAYGIFQGLGRTPASEGGPDAITGPTPPYEDPTQGMGGGDRPAAGMTWWGAVQYARWLSHETGRLYRLPTEAEWELACRAGEGATEGGDAATEGGDAAVDARAWHGENADGRTHPVGTRAPNAWGLHDMLGNVAEWTLDAYRAEPYEGRDGDVHDPIVRGPASGPHAVRGGSFRDGPADLGCALRASSTPRWQRRDPQLPKSRWWNTDAPHVGLRLVASLGEWSQEEIRAYWREFLGGDR